MVLQTQGIWKHTMKAQAVTSQVPHKHTETEQKKAVDGVCGGHRVAATWVATQLARGIARSTDDVGFTIYLPTVPVVHKRVRTMLWYSS